MKPKSGITEGFLTGRFSIMLLVFAALFLVVPVLPDSWPAKRVSDVFSVLVLISCFRAICVQPRFLTFMILFSVIVVLLDSVVLFGHITAHWFKTMGFTLKLIYMVFIFVSIMRYVLDSSPVTVDKVYGALSAYFLMGFAWSIGFTLFQHTNPDSFNIPEDAHHTWATYFSFTTLTTLGYGDISPQSVAARAYAIMEAACGQIFLAVIVARLIALQIMAGPEKKD